MKTLVVLGSTGSIGVQTLEIISMFPDRYEVASLAAGRNVELLADQVRMFRPGLVSVGDDESAKKLRSLLGEGLDLSIVVGASGLLDVATVEADLVVAGLVGAVGLEPTLAALQKGRNVALANKEVMVTAGALVQRVASEQGAQIIPVDSEHSAIFQVLSGQRSQDVKRLILTASGGPFRTWSSGEISNASLKEALNHPNWEMGPKITIDSATLMNKGLEVIEARWLFDTNPDHVDVVVHPESIVHSLVEFVDGSVIAQLGLPDMKVPISVALSFPERLELDLPSLDLTETATLHFERPDGDRFPSLGLAYRALASGEAAPAVLNAANEESVAAFLQGKVSIPDIPRLNECALNEWERRGGGGLRDLRDVREADLCGRRFVSELIPGGSAPERTKDGMFGEADL